VTVFLKIFIWSRQCDPIFKFNFFGHPLDKKNLRIKIKKRFSADSDYVLFTTKYKGQIGVNEHIDKSRLQNFFDVVNAIIVAINRCFG
jgi:hypothetical protein